jgi:hypothetical protein
VILPCAGGEAIVVSPLTASALPDSRRDPRMATSAGERAGESCTRQLLGTEILDELTVGAELLRAVTPASRLFAIGEPVLVGFDWAEAFIFDRTTELCLGQPGTPAQIDEALATR